MNKEYCFNEVEIGYTKKPIKYVINDNGCWECISHAKSRGYCSVKLKGKVYRLHRLIASKYYKVPYDSDLVVRHLCHNKSCINPDHLKFGTQRENIDDNIRDDRHLYGENNGASRLTNKDVYEIKHLISFTNIPLREIGKWYDATDCMMWSINTETDWKHIKINNFKKRVKCRKLTDEEIKEIAHLFLTKQYNKVELAKMFNVERRTIATKIKQEIERQSNK
jgi:hypothetical protein